MVNAPTAPHSNTPSIPDFPTFELPAALWPAQLMHLAELHRGWRAFVELIGENIGDQFVLEGLPLQGLTFETKGSDAGDLLIEVGDEPDFFIHRVASPTAICIADTTPGKELFIHVKGPDGVFTLIRLHRIAELPAGAGQPAEPASAALRPSRRRSTLGRRARRSRPFPWGLFAMGVGGALLLLAMPRARSRRSE